VDCNVGIRREMEALQGIVALLLSLAGLAERAAGRSFVVRWLVLSGLRHADGVARACFVGPSSVARHGHEPADAMNLAVSLRALALVVRNIAALAALKTLRDCRSHDQPCVGRRRAGWKVYGVLEVTGGLSFRALDSPGSL